MGTECRRAEILSLALDIGAPEVPAQSVTLWDLASLLLTNAEYFVHGLAKEGLKKVETIGRRLAWRKIADYSDVEVRSIIPSESFY